MKKNVLFFLLVVHIFVGYGQSNFSIENCIKHLSSQELQGRDANSRGDSLAQIYLIQSFQSMGIPPFFNTYEQPFCSMMRKNRGGLNICSKNIIAFIKGTDSLLKNEFVILSAHYDHVGIQNWSMHPGANDNASGVAGILYLAQKIKTNPLKRSVLIICFGAEEKGLLGSTYFVKNPPFPLKNIDFVVNFDMIGKYHQEGTVYYQGEETISLFYELIEKYAPKHQIKHNKSPFQHLKGSDHYPFYKKRVPILYFNTGMDWNNYHKPSDIPEKIDFQGIEMISNMVFDIITELANQNKKIKFKKK